MHRWDGSKMILPPGQPGPDGKGLFLAGGVMVGDTLWLAGAKSISRFAGGRVEQVKEAPEYLKTVVGHSLGRDLGGFGHEHRARAGFELDGRAGARPQ